MPIGEPTMTPEEEAEWVRKALAGELRNDWPACPHGAVWKHCRLCRREYMRKWKAAKKGVPVGEVVDLGEAFHL